MYELVSGVRNVTCTACGSTLGGNANCTVCKDKQANAHRRRKQIYTLANLTGLSLNTISCYLTTLGKEILPDKIEKLVEDFNKGELSKGDIKNAAKFFLIKLNLIKPFK